MCVKFAVLVFLCISVGRAARRTMMKIVATRRFMWQHAASQPAATVRGGGQTTSCGRSTPYRVKNGSISSIYFIIIGAARARDCREFMRARITLLISYSL